MVPVVPVVGSLAAALARASGGSITRSASRYARDAVDSEDAGSEPEDNIPGNSRVPTRTSRETGAGTGLDGSSVPGGGRPFRAAASSAAKASSTFVVDVSFASNAREGWGSAARRVLVILPKSEKSPRTRLLRPLYAEYTEKVLRVSPRSAAFASAGCAIRARGAPPPPDSPDGSEPGGRGGDPETGTGTGLDGSSLPRDAKGFTSRASFASGDPAVVVVAAVAVAVAVAVGAVADDDGLTPGSSSSSSSSSSSARPFFVDLNPAARFADLYNLYIKEGFFGGGTSFLTLSSDQRSLPERGAAAAGPAASTAAWTDASSVVGTDLKFRLFLDLLFFFLPPPLPPLPPLPPPLPHLPPPIAHDTRGPRDPPNRASRRRAPQR